MHNDLKLDITPTTDQFKKHFSEEVLDELQRMLETVIHSLTTTDNVELAKRIYALMVSALKNQTKDDESGGYDKPDFSTEEKNNFCDN
ncbi:hypothetical protein [Xenorhabdus sp. TH1]|uniref:hypothetical protein n=1 Tax=Xenorhabdus sp. TH1 TaxID=3130166 RepID=UPI0030CECA94